MNRAALALPIEYKAYKTSFTSSDYYYTDIHGIRADMITGITRDLMDGT